MIGLMELLMYPSQTKKEKREGGMWQIPDRSNRLYRMQTALMMFSVKKGTQQNKKTANQTDTQTYTSINIINSIIVTIMIISIHLTAARTVDVDIIVMFGACLDSDMIDIYENIYILRSVYPFLRCTNGSLYIT